MANYTYSGDELDIFAKAKSWKRYWSSIITDYVSGSVLEVGSGHCENVEYFANNHVHLWCALEPDMTLYANAIETVRNKPRLKFPVEHKCGFIDVIDIDEQFDCILYIDVLEHILGDKDQLAKAYKRLKVGGRICIVVPAHSFLFSPFDQFVGHHRRYSKDTLMNIFPAESSLIFVKYLDSIGMFLSLANKYILKSSHVNDRQIWIWNNLVIPISKVVDKFLRFNYGKTIVAVLQKDRI